MVGRHQRHAVIVEPLSADIAHRAGFAKESLHGGEAEGDDDLRLDQLDLLSQPRQTGRHLGRLGFAVARFPRGHVGTALENIGDEDLLAGVIHCPDDLGEQLPRLSDKGFAAQILLFTGCLPHKKQIGEGVADSVDHLGAAGHEVGTSRAGEDPALEFLELGKASVVLCRGEWTSGGSQRGSGRIFHRIDGAQALEARKGGRGLPA